MSFGFIVYKLGLGQSRKSRQVSKQVPQNMEVLQSGDRLYCVVSFPQSSQLRHKVQYPANFFVRDTTYLTCRGRVEFETCGRVVCHEVELELREGKHPFLQAVSVPSDPTDPTCDTGFYVTVKGFELRRVIIRKLLDQRFGPLVTFEENSQTRRGRVQSVRETLWWFINC